MCYTVNGTSSFSSLTPLITSGTYTYPLASYDTYDIFSIKHKGFFVIVQAEEEPDDFLRSLNILSGELPQEEITALENNGTWTLTSLPPHKKALRCKWVYQIKLKSEVLLSNTKLSLLSLEIIRSRVRTT